MHLKLMKMWVIPLHNLGDYSNGIERINIELSINNKLKLINELLPLHRKIFLQVLKTKLLIVNY